MLKKLSAKHYEAALLIWGGASHADVAEKLGVTVAAVKSWGHSQVFKDEIKRLQSEQNQRTQSELDAAVDFQAQVRQNTRDLYALCHGKIREAIELIELDAPSYRSFPPLVKAMRDLTELALNVDEATLGLEQLAKEIDGINKAS